MWPQPGTAFSVSLPKVSPSYPHPARPRDRLATEQLSGSTQKQETGPAKARERSQATSVAHVTPLPSQLESERSGASPRGADQRSKPEADDLCPSQLQQPQAKRS